MRRRDNNFRAQETTSQARRTVILAAAFFLTCFRASAQASQPSLQDPTTQPATPTRRIVVSIPDRKLALIEEGRVVRIYSVAVGASSTPSPSGQFTIVDRVLNPTYYRPGVVIETGPDNPLGTRWIGLSVKGFGIHGTNKPRSIGHNASHGCIRLGKDDIEDLFERVRVGDSVELVRERTAEIAQLFDEPEQSPVQTDHAVLVAQASAEPLPTAAPIGQE